MFTLKDIQDGCFDLSLLEEVHRTEYGSGERVTKASLANGQLLEFSDGDGFIHEYLKHTLNLKRHAGYRQTLLAVRCCLASAFQDCGACPLVKEDDCTALLLKELDLLLELLPEGIG